MKCKRCDSEKFISNNDNLGGSAIGSYIQWKEGERELDSGETEAIFLVVCDPLMNEL